MKTLFNDGWHFAEFALDEVSMYKDGNPVLFTPDQFFDLSSAQKYENVRLPHDWQIYHTKDLYKNSVGFYKKSFQIENKDISENAEVAARYVALRFEAVYMNSAVWVNGKKAGEWKYGYSTFEFDISSLIHEGENEILVIAVYQNCNTRWYSGAGIIREKFSSLVTDALRGEWLEQQNYKVQMLEFIDMEHTPKNILIRAVKKTSNPQSKKVDPPTLMTSLSIQTEIYNN